MIRLSGSEPIPAPADRVLVFWDTQRDAWMLRMKWFSEGYLARQETSELADGLPADLDADALWCGARSHPLIAGARYERLPDLPGDGFEWAIAGCSQALHDHYVHGTEEAFRGFFTEVKSCDWGLHGLCPRCGSQRFYVTDESKL